MVNLKWTVTALTGSSYPRLVHGTYYLYSYFRNKFSVAGMFIGMLIANDAIWILGTNYSQVTDFLNLQYK